MATKKTSTNMSIWDAVSETDPRHTKKVQQRGGFTAIDAMYQLQMATEQFGPIGEGWGYEASYQFVETRAAHLVACELTLWQGSPDNKFGPIMATNVLVNDKGRVDDDAPKKAMTDALTKGLSQLGFSADVFLGKFDDNKYVSDLNSKYGVEVRQASTSTQPAGYDDDGF